MQKSDAISTINRPLHLTHCAQPVTTTLTIIRPDDWHLHVRDGEALSSVIPHTAQRFARAIIMPNLAPPVTTTELASAYRQRIIRAIPPNMHFKPLMTLYLTDQTTPAEIKRAHNSGLIYACKLYPAGATTHSESGVTRIDAIYPALEAMQAHQLPLLVHGEVVDPDIDVFDREQVFIERILAPLHQRYPQLRIVFEHITTRAAVDFVLSCNDKLGATITPQHLLYNRNALFHGGLRPHFYCLPVLKRETHRQALLEAAISGNPKFFLGTDSAPHGKHQKESACGCAGIYSAHAGIEFYAEAFDAAGSLDKLETFASLNGARFYGLAVNTDTITLEKQDWTVPAEYPLGNSALVPLRAGDNVHWRCIT